MVLPEGIELSTSPLPKVRHGYHDLSFSRSLSYV